MLCKPFPFKKLRVVWPRSSISCPPAKRSFSPATTNPWPPSAPHRRLCHGSSVNSALSREACCTWLRTSMPFPKGSRSMSSEIVDRYPHPHLGHGRSDEVERPDGDRVARSNQRLAAECGDGVGTGH